jgi:transposase InsO family protein
LLLVLLRTYFSDLDLPRATLHRELKVHPAWPFIRRQRKGGRRHRVRFRAKAPHHIWQLDAKGSFNVRFKSGEEIRVVTLTILDDYSRAVLATTISTSENLGAAVRVFRDAAARWGLPDQLYADRHSVYDSYAFRTGIGDLGVHRIDTKAGDAPPRGKIEAYHRVLKLWFISELPYQVVIDLVHLEQLLQAFIAVVYQPHRHRELKKSPAEALAEIRSGRPGISLNRLRDAFWVETTLKAHPTTGEINLPGGLFCVPSAYAGQTVALRHDPAEPSKRVFLIGKAGRPIPLHSPYEEKGAKLTKPKTARRGTGALQRLCDTWHGRELPVAAPAFGFPEFCEAIAKALGRPIAQTEEEAAIIQEFHRKRGPFAPEAFDQALEKVLAELGPNRPVDAILNYLNRLIVPSNPKDEEEAQ